MVCIRRLIFVSLIFISSRASPPCEWNVSFFSLPKFTRFSCDKNDYGYVDLIPSANLQQNIRITKIEFQMCDKWYNNSDVKLFKQKKRGYRGDANVEVVSICSKIGGAVYRTRTYSCDRKPFDFIRVGFPDGKTGKIDKLFIFKDHATCELTTTSSFFVSTSGEPSSTAMTATTSAATVPTTPASVSAELPQSQIAGIVCGVVFFILILVVLFIKMRCECRAKQESQVTHIAPNDQQTRADEHIYGNIIRLPVRSEPIYVDLQFSNNLAMESKKRQTSLNPPELVYENISDKRQQPVEEGVIYSQITNTVQAEHRDSYLNSVQ